MLYIYILVHWKFLQCDSDDPSSITQKLRDTISAFCVTHVYITSIAKPMHHVNSLPGIIIPRKYDGLSNDVDNLNTANLNTANFDDSEGNVLF